MSKLPKIPDEQASSPGQKSEVQGEGGDRRDLRTDVRDGRPGDAALNTEQQGRFGDIKQNTTHQGYQQDR